MIYLFWCLVAVYFVSKLAAAVVADQILTAVNEKLPVYEQLGPITGFGRGRHFRSMYKRFYPTGRLLRRLHGLSILSVVSGILAVATYVGLH